MRNVVIKSLAALLIMFSSSCFARGGDVPVHGYTKADGTYVGPYMRTAPDTTAANNFSASGNYNPYTGAYGTRNPSFSRHPASPAYPFYAPPALSFEDQMQSWMGHRESELLVRFGSPYKTHKQKGGGMSYEYTNFNQRIEFFADPDGVIQKWKSWGYNL